MMVLNKSKIIERNTFDRQDFLRPRQIALLRELYNCCKLRSPQTRERCLRISPFFFTILRTSAPGGSVDKIQVLEIFDFDLHSGDKFFTLCHIR